MAFFVQGAPERPSAMARFGEGLGQGISASIAQRMESLAQEKKIATQREAQKKLAQEAFEMGLPTVGMLHMMGVSPDKIMDYAKEQGLPELESKIEALRSPKSRGPVEQLDMMGKGRKAEGGVPESYDAMINEAQNTPQENQMFDSGDRQPSIEPTKQSAKPKTFDDYIYDIDPKYDQRGANQKEKIQKQAERRFNADIALRKEVAPLAKKENEKISSLSDKLENEEVALNDQEIALQSGDIGSPLVNWFSEKTGLESLKTPSAVLLKRASKENVMSNIKEVTSKAANQWLERQLQSAYANVLYSPESNWILHESQKTNHDIGKKKLEVYNQLYDIYKDDPAKLKSEQTRLVHDYAMAQLKNLRTKIELIKKSYIPVKPGTYLPEDLAELIFYQEGHDKQRARIRTRNLGYAISQGNENARYF